MIIKKINNSVNGKIKLNEAAPKWSNKENRREENELRDKYLSKEKEFRQAAIARGDFDIHDDSDYPGLQYKDPRFSKDEEQQLIDLKKQIKAAKEAADLRQQAHEDELRAGRAARAGVSPENAKKFDSLKKQISSLNSKIKSNNNTIESLQNDNIELLKQINELTAKLESLKN